MTFSLEDHRQASMTLGKDYVFGDYVELRFLLWNRNPRERRRANARLVCPDCQPGRYPGPRRGLVLRSRVVFTNVAALGRFVPGVFYRGFLRGFLVPHSDDGSSEK